MLKVVDIPGPLSVETINSADWQVPLSGLVNLNHEKARAVKLQDRSEPISVDFHVVRHPTRGTFIVDTGVEKALRDAPESSAFAGPVSWFMHLELLNVHVPLAEWVAQEKKLDGVFLTHLHTDHVSGMPDVPHGTPIYSGPHEASGTAFHNFALRRPMDRVFSGQAPISELQFKPDPERRFSGVVDVFGDGSFWAIWVPGHTEGSLAFVARTVSGPVLMTGDT
jgi:glyoxylase-like metal-dependent hydrolase (beta-lactamase superfamily II)